MFAGELLSVGRYEAAEFCRAALFVRIISAYGPDEKYCAKTGRKSS